jgi:hypothetical protein
MKKKETNNINLTREEIDPKIIDQRSRSTIQGWEWGFIRPEPPLEKVEAFGLIDINGGIDDFSFSFGVQHAHKVARVRYELTYDLVGMTPGSITTVFLWLGIRRPPAGILVSPRNASRATYIDIGGETQEKISVESFPQLDSLGNLNGYIQGNFNGASMNSYGMFGSYVEGGSNDTTLGWRIVLSVVDFFARRSSDYSDD